MVISMSETYSVKMRAARSGVHVSGAEKIVSAASVSKVASRLVERALSHERGTPDFINVKIEAQPADIIHLAALPVETHVVASPAEGRALAARLLAEAGIARADEIMARFSTLIMEINGIIAIRMIMRSTSTTPMGADAV